MTKNGAQDGKGKGRAKTKRVPSAWNKHVQSVWNKNKSKKGYKFSDALKDAKKTYKKVSGKKKAKK